MNDATARLNFNTRQLKNDLVGNLQGSLLFAQASVLPSRASAIPGDVQPRLVARRHTLVLFKPLGNFDHESGIALVIGRDPSAAFVMNMNPPSELPPVTEWESDATYAQVAYGADFWSLFVPGEHIMPGMKVVVASGSQTGEFENVDVGAPVELLLNTIDIGMLTPPRTEFIDKFTQERQRQYFQSIPCSRLVVNQYEPVATGGFLIMPDGTQYSGQSNDAGDWQSGDLREILGKQLISLGINNANLGIHSSPGRGEDGANKHFVTAQFTAHSSVGQYRNGRVVHGGSGGGSMVTLENCIGNEFSHELGHNYGLGHYPNGFAGSVHRAADSINSGWGWDSDINRFIPNFEKARRGGNACHDGECQAPFHQHRYGTDTMAGGAPLYPATSGYTLHTPFSLNTVQAFLEDKAVMSRSSSTGYLKWQESTKSMEEWAEFYSAAPSEWAMQPMIALLEKYQRVKIQVSNEHYAAEVLVPTAVRLKGVHIVHEADADSLLRINGTTVPLKKGTVLYYESTGSHWAEVSSFSVQVARRPDQRGVPTTTIVGFYDPEDRITGLAYPALHCAYGTTYAADGRVELDAALVQAAVRNHAGQLLGFVLASHRFDPGSMNRFHLNVPRSFGPVGITIYRQGKVLLDRYLDPPVGTARAFIHGIG